MKTLKIILIILVIAALGYLIFQSNGRPLGSGITECRFASATNASSSVDSTSKNTIVAADSSRTYLSIMNNSTNTVYLNLSSATATAGTGIILSTLGSKWETGCGAESDYTGSVTAITSSGTSSLSVIYK